MQYPSDLKDKEWNLISHHFEYGNYGKSRKHSPRLMVNAIFYIVKSGCQWRMLPKDYPSWKTVYSFFSRAKRKGIWEKIMQDLVKINRLQLGRNENPSFSIIDSQSIKTTSSGENRGIDGGKKNKRP